MRRPPTLPTLATIFAATAAVFACGDRLGTGPEFALASRPSPSGPTVTPQETGTTFRFFAVSPVNDKVVWASAAGGTFAKTTDGGVTWVSRQVPGAEALQFRDVQGVSERVAYLMSAGSGADNRLYMTQDGGNTWVLQYQATDPRAFHDCFDFWTPTRALLFGDSFDDHFTILKLSDGRTWENISAQSPVAQGGEGGFAASGTCIKTLAGQSAWIGTGAAPQARVLATRDGGATWTVSTAVPIEPRGTATSGVASIDFRDPVHGIIGGGDVAASTAQQSNVARSSDGGATWSLTTPTPFPGAVYGLSYVPGKRLTVVATGPGGSAWTADEGDTWAVLPDITDCWTVGFSGKRGWLGCGAGKIFRIDFSD